MTADPGLFPEPDHAPDPLDGLGVDARRTARQRADIERGIHPLTKRPLLAGNLMDAETGVRCGDCVKLHRSGGYLKCAERGDSRSAATDARRWWPACDLFKSST